MQLKIAKAVAPAHVKFDNVPLSTIYGIFHFNGPRSVKVEH